MKVNLADYASGGRVATDLVNTSPGVRRLGGEALTDPAALDDLLRAYTDTPLAGTARGRSSRTDLHAVLDLRTTVRSVIETSDEFIIEGAHELLRRVPLMPILTSDAGGWQWSVETPADASLADELAVLIGVGVLATIRALGRDRIRDCSADDCTGVFIDTSRSGRRRYCTPGLCGNRANVARFRARQRDGEER